MSILRRYHRSHNICFITCVTYERKPILIDYIQVFRDSFASVNSRTDFNLIAHVFLPDHFHLILDPGDNDFVGIMQRLKMSFGMRYRKLNGMSSGRIWQHRYWDHIIRDQLDMNRHIDYIHFNPAKHGLVRSPFDWEYSSIHRYRKESYYTGDWGVTKPPTFTEAFGE